MKNDLIIDNIPYVSVWDGGIEVRTTCTVNLKTGEVTEIAVADVGGLDVCEEQYVVLTGETVYIYENEHGFSCWADIHGELGCLEEDPLTNIGLEQEQMLETLKIYDTPQQVIHIEWENLSDIFSELLSGFLHRKITAKSYREEYYYWLIRLFAAPLTQAELETLFDLSGADQLDRDENDYGEYPVVELCQSLCAKLMGKLLPFEPRCTIADDEGVWFISSVTDPMFIEKALPDGTSLVAETWEDPEYPGIRISLRVPGSEDELLCFAEHNSGRPVGKELCVAAYASNQDDPAYYESYIDPQQPSPNI